jgi:hypothetical protein
VTGNAIAEVPVLFDGKHPFTFHACRRTFMSLLEAESVPREIIGALAGHAGKTVADRHYIAKNLKRFHEAVCRLPLPTALPWVPEASSQTPRRSSDTERASISFPSEPSRTTVHETKSRSFFSTPSGSPFISTVSD